MNRLSNKSIRLQEKGKPLRASLKRLSGAKEGIKGIERGQYLLSAKTSQNFSHKKTREHLGNLVETQKEGLAGQQGLNSPPFER